MSKKIEPGQKLSAFDKQYLQDRGLDVEDIDTDADEVDATDVDASAVKLAEAERVITELQERIVALEAENQVLKTDAENVTVPDDEPEDAPYSEWENDELRLELKNRGLKQGGAKDELVARLEAYDAEHAGDDDESDA